MPNEVVRLSRKDRFILFYGILLGALFGALGNFVVSYYIEWQKSGFATESLWRTGYFIALLIFAAFCIVLGVVAFWYLLSGEEKEYRQQEEKTPLSKDKARSLEYQELARSVWNRGREYVTMQSILISGSLLAVSYVARNITQMNLMIVRAVLFGSILLILLAYILYYTTNKINIKFWKRIHRIENLIEIEVGHHGMYEEIKSEGWFKLRRIIWDIILGSLLFFYVAALIWTFIFF